MGIAGGGLFESHPHYYAISWFAVIGIVAALQCAFDWQRDSAGWRTISILFAFTMLVLAAFELSFAFAPDPGWIRIDLLFTFPYSLGGMALLAGKAVWRAFWP